MPMINYKEELIDHITGEIDRLQSIGGTPQQIAGIIATDYLRTIGPDPRAAVVATIRYQYATIYHVLEANYPHRIS